MRPSGSSVPVAVFASGGGTTLQALLDPGDEVLLPEPAFDLYYGQVRLAGGTVRPVALKVDDDRRTWSIDLDALAAAAATGKPKLRR